MWILVLNTGAYESEKDAPSMGPSPIINIKKEKRETEEETKEILRSLERDNVGRFCLYSASLFHIFFKSNFCVLWHFISL